MDCVCTQNAYLSAASAEIHGPPASSAPVARMPAPVRSQQSLEALMGAYVEGNAEAFDALYRLLAPRLYGYLLRLTRNPERAEDLVQVTFTKVHRARASYLSGAPLLPWCLAIARRSFYDEIRAAKSRKEDLSADGTLPERPVRQDSLPSDLADSLEQAMAQLPENYREAIILTKITGLSMTEAAGVLGTTSTAVKLRVHRGYKTLRRLMNHSGGQQS